MTDRALAVLDDGRGGPEFLWVHYYDAHDPYGDTGQGGPSLFRLMQLASRSSPRLPRALSRARAGYAEDVEALDRSLARLLERLLRDADRIPTHVVLVSDHGESFGEGGSLGHGQRITPAEIHVPLVVLSPDVGPGVRRDVAGSEDVFATLLALAGLAPDGVGRDLRTVAEGAAFGMRRSYSEPYPDPRTDGRMATLSGPWFYAARGAQLLTGDAATVTVEDDPERPASELEAATLRPLFADFAHALEGAVADERLDAETQKALRALGYVR